MKKVKVSIVKYTNSLPFLYGLENHSVNKNILLSSDTPADCYEKLLKNQVDIGLVPVVILQNLPGTQIISNHCISSKGKVHTVLLASSVPLNEIKTIVLDYQSRASVKLVEVLSRFFWKINPEFLPADEGYDEKEIPPETAFLVIGDRCFPYYHKEYLIYDLGEEWYRYTGKPFVFAAWITNKVIEAPFIRKFGQALDYGINHREELIGQIEGQYKSGEINLHHYFYHNLGYTLGPEETEGLNLFLHLVQSLKNNPQ